MQILIMLHLAECNFRFRIGMTIGPIEESYAVLNKYGMSYQDTNTERVDSLSYGWKKLVDQVRGLRESMSVTASSMEESFCLIVTL